MAEDNTKKIGVTSLQGAVGGAASAVNSNDPVAEYAGIRKEMAQRFELLPEDIKALMMGDAYQQGLFEVAKAQKLTYEEMGTLEMNTSMVLLGMIPPTEYREEISRDLKKSDAETDAIVNIVNEKIFTPIRASLEKVYAAKRDPADFLEDAPAEAVSAAVATTTPVSTPTPMADARITPAPTFGTFPTIPTAPVAPKPAPTLSTSEKSMLEKTGVVISETPAPTPSAPISSRSDLLQSIENPTKKPTPTIPMSAPATPTIVDRLKSAAPMMPATKTTDYSIVKPPAATPTPAPGTSGARLIDPYREKID